MIPLDKEPQIGSIFVQKTSSNLLVRVVRIPAVADEIVGDRNMKVIILETGEFTYIDSSKPGSYEIPENLRYVPSYAHLCKLVEVNI